MSSVALLTLTSLLGQGIAFLYRIALTRLAGAEILGLYQLIMPVYAVLLSLTSVGLTTALSNLSARYQALGDRRAIYQARGQAMRLFFSLAVLPCGLLLAFSDAASVYLLGDARTQLGLLLLVPCLLLTGTENLHKHYFYGVGRPAPAALSDLAEQALKAVTILTLLIVRAPVHPEAAVGTIVLGMTLCEVLSAGAQLVLFRHYLGDPRRLPGAPVPPAALRRQMLTIALPLGAAALLGNLLSSANAVLLPRLLVLGGLDQGEAVSAYGVTFGMTIPLLMLPTAFLSALGLVLTPKLARAHALGQRGTIRRLTRRSLLTANLLLVPALTFLAIAGPELGAVLYKEPTVGENLPLLALGVFLSCWQTLFSWVLTSTDRQLSSAAIALVCDALQLALTCLLVPRMGMEGYAWSFLAASALGAGACGSVVLSCVRVPNPVQ